MKKLIAGCLFVAASGMASASNLLLNGSFEDPSQREGTWQVYSSIPGWTATTGPGLEIRNSIVGEAQHGQNFVELDSHNATDTNSTIAQTISGLTAGATYEVSYWYSPRIGQPASTNGIKALWNGVEQRSIAELGLSVNSWSNLTFLVTATGGANTLAFAAFGTDDTLGGNIDNVSLSAVPLPAAAWLFGSALMGFGVLRRKQKAGSSEMTVS
jgi:hypothetical protein